MNTLDTRFEEYTIEEFHAAVRRGAVTSVELTEWYLARIAAVDGSLRSIITVNPDAIAAARAADEFFAATGQLSGPLHGVPVLVKDQAETAGLRTTFGSTSFADFVPDRDSTIVRRVKDAGGFVLAKTAMNDLACGYSSHCTMVGTTRNPYDPARDTGGSSSGTGAAVAANLGLVGIGEDTGGSIRVPSSFNNLFGLRVTAGLISRTGLQGLVPNQDTPGPMTRSVGDLAVLLDVLEGFDDADPLTVTAAQVRDRLAFATAAATSGTLKRPRIGVLSNVFPAGSGEGTEISSIVRSAIARLREEGFDIVDGIELPDLDGWNARTSLYGTVSRSVLQSFFASHGERFADYEAFLAAEAHNPALSTFVDIAGGADDPLEDPAYLRGLAEQTRFRQEVLAIMARHGVDVLLYPTTRVLPPRFDEMEAVVDVAAFPTNTIIGSQAVLPAMSVPAGFTADGVPVGMELLAGHLDERSLVALAAEWERIASPRRRPDLTWVESAVAAGSLTAATPAA
ncbi:hypothetical protein GCM10028787_31910 [Brachybacterium horti]